MADVDRPCAACGHPRAALIHQPEQIVSGHAFVSEPPPVDPLREAADMHVVYAGGPPCADTCPGPWSQWHDGYSYGFETGERFAAPRSVEQDDDGRPRLDAETIAHDKGVMEGYLAAKRDYSPGGMYAAPRSVETAGLREAAQDILTSFARRPGWVLEHDSEEADALRAALGGPK